MPARAVTKMPVRSLGLNQVIYTMSFVGNAAAAPTVLYDNADGEARFSVSAPSTGVYTVQLPAIAGGFPSEVNPVGTCVSAAGGDLTAVAALYFVKDSYDPATGTFDVAFQLNDALANAASDFEMSITLAMRLGRVGRQRS